MMFLEILVLFALAAVLLASVFKKQITAVKSEDGGIPLVNKFSVEEMDADLLGVLKSCKEEYGDVFKLQLAKDKAMVFVLDPHMVQGVQNNPSFDFVKVSQQSKKRFGLVKFTNDPHAIATLSSSLKTSLSGQPLRVMLGEMEELMKAALTDILGAEMTVSLFDLCHRVVFTSVVKVLCGRHVDTDGLLPLYKEFNVLIPKRHGAASAVQGESPAIVVFKKMAKILGVSESQLGQPVSNLRKACSKTITDAGIDEDEALKILTTIMWASTANEVSAAFWTMSEALTRPDVIEELRSYILNRPEADSDLFLRSVVWEAIRVHSNPNSFRVAKENTTIRNSEGREFTIQEGEWVAMQNYFMHFDPEIFSNPETFQPKRFLPAEGSTTPPRFYKHGKMVKTPVNAFGNGIGACPGKQLALVVLVNFLKMCVLTYDMKPLGPVPPTKKDTTVSTPQPDGDMLIRCIKL